MSRVEKSRFKKRRKKLILAWTFIIAVTSLFVYNIFKNTNSENKVTSNFILNSTQNEVLTNPNNISKLTLNAIGDVMAHHPQLDAQYNSSNKTYSFDNNFKYVKKYIENADISIANLETTFAGPTIPYTSYPTFNTPDSLADALKYAGIDVLSTINNHSFDKGDLGMERTLEVVKSKGFDTIGTVENINDKNYIIKDINGINLGITSFSYGEIIKNNKHLNGVKISDKSKYKMNIFDMNNVQNAFDTINKTLNNIKDSDIQILLIHWGYEYQRNPSSFQKELAQMLCDSGIDIIIGSHPHVIQPSEFIKSTNGKNETLVIYSLGNFLSNQRRELLGTPYTEDGLIANIEITKDSNKNETKVSRVDFIPTWVNKYKESGKNVYEIIPIADKNELSNISNLPIDKVRSSYKNTASQIEASDILNIPKNPFE